MTEHKELTFHDLALLAKADSAMDAYTKATGRSAIGDLTILWRLESLRGDEGVTDEDYPLKVEPGWALSKLAGRGFTIEVDSHWADAGYEDECERVRKAADDAGLLWSEDGPPATHSADHGSGWMVQVEYNTNADGGRIPFDEQPKPTTLHGPFSSEEEAVGWMNTYPESRDIFDMTVVVYNKVREQ